MKTIDAATLRVQLASAFPFAVIILSDADYACPTTQWLTGPFWGWFQKSRWDLGLSKWERTNDCDNFARAYAQGAADSFALTPFDGLKPEGVAVGEFYYHSSRGPHAICIALTGDTAPIFVEPQTGQLLTIPQPEASTCFFVRF
jgi:hypothetical protein